MERPNKEEILRKAEFYFEAQAYHQAKLLYWAAGEEMPKVSDKQLEYIPRGDIT